MEPKAEEGLKGRSLQREKASSPLVNRLRVGRAGSPWVQNVFCVVVRSLVERSLQGKPNMVATTSCGVLRTVLPINACTGGQYSGTGNLPLRSSAL